MKMFLTFKEDEAYRQGQRDARCGRRDLEMNKYADYDTPDRAYFEGYYDTQKELDKKRREEDESNSEGV